MTGVRPRSATCEAIRTRTPSTIRTIRAAPPMAAPMAISAIPASTSPTPSTRTRTPGTDHAPLSVIGRVPGPSPRSSDSCVVITLTSGWPGLISVSERIRARRPAAARPALHHAADGDLAHLVPPLRGGPGSDPYAVAGQGEFEDAGTTDKGRHPDRGRVRGRQQGGHQHRAGQRPGA